MPSWRQLKQNNKFWCRFQGHREVEITTSDKAKFSLSGKMNHNLHKWGTENQHFTIELERDSLHQFLFAKDTIKGIFFGHSYGVVFPTAAQSLQHVHFPSA